MGLNETWKPVVGYEGFYEVSDFGNVRSVDHICKSRYGYRQFRGKVLKQVPDKDGYFKVSLCKNNNKRQAFVHRLVAEAFVDNPCGYPVINHKDENKQNNHAENLEFCTIQYNSTYNDIHYRKAKKVWKPVVAYNSTETHIFPSIKAAADAIGVLHGNISGCIHGYRGRKTLKGYSFRLANPNEIERLKQLEINNNR